MHRWSSTFTLADVALVTLRVDPGTPLTATASQLVALRARYERDGYTDVVVTQRAGRLESVQLRPPFDLVAVADDTHLRASLMVVFGLCVAAVVLILDTERRRNTGGWFGLNGRGSRQTPTV